MKLPGIPILRPLFTAIARMPLIGPHNGQETALLLSGAKPVAMFAASDDLAALHEAADQGRLIRCEVPRAHTITDRLYFWPDVNENDLLFVHGNHTGQSQPPYTPEQRDSFKRILQDAGFAGTYFIRDDKLPRAENIAVNALKKIPIIKDNFWLKLGLKNHVLTSNMEEFIEGQRRAYCVKMHSMDSEKKSGLHNIFESMVTAGRIARKDVTYTHQNDMTIFGQPGQEENVAALAFMLENYDSSAFAPEQEGEILGYSDADIKLWNNGWPKNAALTFLMKATQAARRDMRHAAMKEAGPNWSRNP